MEWRQLAYLKHATLESEGELFGWASKAKALHPGFSFFFPKKQLLKNTEKRIGDLLRKGMKYI